MKKIGEGVGGFAGQSFYHYGYVVSGVDMDYQITRGVEIVFNNQVFKPIADVDEILNVTDTTSDWGGIKSIEIDQAPPGARKAYFVDKIYKVMDYGIIWNNLPLRDTNEVKDFNTKQEALDYIEYLNRSTTVSNTSTQTNPSVTTKPVELFTNTSGINIGDTITVTEKALIALPTWSAHFKGSTSQNGNSCIIPGAQKYIFSKSGKIVLQVINDDTIPSGHACYNNHPIESEIPVSFGDYQLTISNLSGENIVAGFIRPDENRYPYAMYYPNNHPNTSLGLDKASIYKQVNPGVTEVIPCNIIKDREYYNNGTHVEVRVSLIVNNSIYTGEYEISWDWGNNWSPYYGIIAQVGLETRIRLRAKYLSNTEVELIINPNNRTIKLESAKNATISEEHSFISVQVPYDNNLNNGNPHYKHNYKMFNNKGTLTEDRIINQSWSNITE